METRRFCLRSTGKGHIWGATDCPGCEPFNGNYPRPHREYDQSVSCAGLVHAERVPDGDKIIYHCDGCFANVG